MHKNRITFSLRAYSGAETMITAWTDGTLAGLLRVIVEAWIDRGQGKFGFEPADICFISFPNLPGYIDGEPFMEMGWKIWRATQTRRLQMAA